MTQEREIRHVKVTARAIRAADAVVDFFAFVLIAILSLYAGYSFWYSNSLINDSFLPDDIAMYKPTGHDPTLSDLMGINPDVCAWLTIDGTNIDYPVVQGRTDTDYLNRNVMGEFSLAGSIFLSAANSPGFVDPYNMVYGHHVSGGAMFSDVLEFRDDAFFDRHPSGVLWLEDRAFAVELFACLSVDAYDAVVYKDAGSVKAEELPTLVEDICSRAVQKRDASIVPGDSVIALSTCENATNTNRVVLFGKLVPLTAEQMSALEAANDEAMQQDRPAGSTQPRGSLLRHLPALLLAGIIFAVLLALVYRLRSRRKG